MMPFLTGLLCSAAWLPADAPAWPKVALLLTAEDATIKDKSLTQRTVRLNGNVARNTSVTKHGIPSIQFDGSGDFIQFADTNDWNPANSPFTFEGWFRFEGKQNNQALFGQWDDAGSAGNSNFYLFIQSGGLTFRMNNNSDVFYSWAPTLGQFYHIAICRDAAFNTRMFINGALVAVQNQPNWNNDSGNFLVVGRIGSGTTFATYDFNGYMADVRFTRRAALYTAAFTPPSQAFYRGPSSPKTFWDTTVIPAGKINVPSWIDYREAQKIGENITAYALGAHGKSSGKWRASLRATAMGFNTNLGLGLCGTGINTGSYIGADNQSIGWEASQSAIKKNAAVLASPGAFVAGDMIDIFVDIDAGKCWFARNGVLVSGDPAAGTGGFDISSFTKPIRPTAYMWSAASVVDLMFGETQYDGIAGFKDWEA